MDSTTLTKDLDMMGKAIDASSQYRQEAITKKSMWEQQVTEKDSELKALGTTPETARTDIEKIDNEILQSLEKLKNMVPLELLRKKGRI